MQIPQVFPVGEGEPGVRAVCPKFNRDCTGGINPMGGLPGFQGGCAASGDLGGRAN